MKYREGFISNSSSTSFIIENKTKENLYLCDFIKENSQLIIEFENEYFPLVGKKVFLSHSGKELFLRSIDEIIKQMCEESRELEKSGKNGRKKPLSPGENLIVFGDEQGTLLGEIYDYILREGGESKRFTWRFDSYNR
jgi:hypothetical protein